MSLPCILLLCSPNPLFVCFDCILLWGMHTLDRATVSVLPFPFTWALHIRPRSSACERVPLLTKPSLLARLPFSCPSFLFHSQLVPLLLLGRGAPLSITALCISNLPVVNGALYLMFDLLNGIMTLTQQLTKTF